MNAAGIAGGAIGTPIAFPPQGATDAKLAYASQAVGNADVDNDGLADMVFSSSITRKLRYYKRLSATPGDYDLANPHDIDAVLPAAGDPRPTVVGDVTGDGKADIILSLAGSGSTDTAKLNIYLYTGQGSGSFARSTIATGLGTVTNFPSGITAMALADSDGDGRLDLVLLAPTTTTNANQIWIFTNVGGSTPFDSTHKTSIAGTSVLIGYGTMWGAIAVGDFTGDGHADIMAIGNNKKLYRLNGNGNGTFASPALLQTLSSISFGSHVMAAVDADSDGTMDVALANAYSSTDKSLYWFAGDGAGGISSTPNQTITSWGTNVATELTECTYKANGASCSDDANPCTTDLCSAGICVHAAGNAGTTCHSSTGPCDDTVSCTGVSTTCPNAFHASGSSCPDDANPCTTDLCNGVSGACQHAAGHSGAVCRPATTSCDPAEVCSGTSPVCPTDVLTPDGTACSDGNACTGADSCHSGQCVGTPCVLDLGMPTIAYKCPTSAGAPSAAIVQQNGQSISPVPIPDPHHASGFVSGVNVIQWSLSTGETATQAVTCGN